MKGNCTIAIAFFSSSDGEDVCTAPGGDVLAAREREDNLSFQIFNCAISATVNIASVCWGSPDRVGVEWTEETGLRQVQFASRAVQLDRWNSVILCWFWFIDMFDDKLNLS